ncbi:helix-turn-helix domain-containing protein [Burkholderia gladioli]|uniref:winged helix-turn-helix transcriptional regulator n=1 Tax=Burkholderia gladioli TaxID=28095 RepID=UPI002656CFE4|nr:helix-turn-helix domain-containing protein [Burkholderia gladioli]MDN7500230.1 helix-turn-helix domain-containing protein [Burkholderia gladioli]
MKLETKCPVAFTSRILGGKWKARIVWALVRDEPLRFSEIRRACPPVSDRILTKELRELEHCGLISRKEFPVIPPKTEYRLTTLGQTLRPVMAVMAEWGSANRENVIEPPKDTRPPASTEDLGHDE